MSCMPDIFAPDHSLLHTVSKMDSGEEDASADFTGYFLVALVFIISNVALIRATWVLAG